MTTVTKFFSSDEFLLLERITDKLSDAVQSDMENGVSSLNATAAADFQRKYPAIHEFHLWLNELYYDAMPDE